MYALLSGDGPSVTVPSVATTLTSSWECSPPPNTHTPPSMASWTTACAAADTSGNSSSGKVIAPSSNELRYRVISRLLSRRPAPAASHPATDTRAMETDKPPRTHRSGQIQPRREQHPDRRVREDDPLVGHRAPYALRRALHDARPPGLVLVREPHELGLERAHPQLALGARLVELAEANGYVAADDDRTPARLDDDHLHAARVARRRDEAEPGQELELAVDRLVAHARRVDPLADRVVVLRARVLELLPLNVNRPSGEQVVAAAVVEMQVRVDDDVDAGEVERLLAQWDEAGVHVGHLRAQLRHAGVDQHAAVGMVDDMDADRPALALDEQLGHQQGRDRGRRRHSPILPPPANCLPSRLLRSGVMPERWRTPRTIRRFPAQGYSTRWAAAAAAVS